MVEVDSYQKKTAGRWNIILNDIIYSAEPNTSN